MIQRRLPSTCCPLGAPVILQKEQRTDELSPIQPLTVLNNGRFTRRTLSVTRPICRPGTFLQVLVDNGTPSPCKPVASHSLLAASMLLTATCPEYQHNPGVGAPGFFPEFIIYMPSSFSFQAHYIPTGHFIQYGRPQEVYIPKKSKMVVYIAFSIQNSDIQIY